MSGKRRLGGAGVDARSACPECLRRSWLIARLGAWIQRVVDDRAGSRTPELLRLDSETLVAAVAAKQADKILAWNASLTEGEMVAAIEDNGVGIGPDVIGGIGLKSMQDRAAEVGGELTIEPRAGGGTRVTGRFPLSATEVPND